MGGCLWVWDGFSKLAERGRAEGSARGEEAEEMATEEQEYEAVGFEAGVDNVLNAGGDLVRTFAGRVRRSVP